MLTHGIKIFTGTGTPAHAAEEAEMLCNRWLQTHKWTDREGRSVYRTSGHFDPTPGGIGGWGVYFLHLHGPLEETM